MCGSRNEFIPVLAACERRCVDGVATPSTHVSRPDRSNTSLWESAVAVHSKAHMPSPGPLRIEGLCHPAADVGSAGLKYQAILAFGGLGLRVDQQYLAQLSE